MFPDYFSVSCGHCQLKLNSLIQAETHYVESSTCLKTQYQVIYDQIFVVDGSMIILYLNVTLSLNQIFDYVVRLPQAASYKNTMFLLQLLLQESLLQPLHFCKKLNKSKLKTLSTDTLSKFNFSSSYWKVHCRKSNDSKSTSSDNSLFPH